MQIFQNPSTVESLNSSIFSIRYKRSIQTVGVSEPRQVCKIILYCYQHFYLPEGHVLIFVLVFITNSIIVLSFLTDVHRPVITLHTEQKGTGANFKPLMSKNFKLASKDKVFATNLFCNSTM